MIKNLAMAALKCPGCSGSMQRVFIKEVELDWCGACRGLWFDRGELRAALKMDGEVHVTRDHPASRCPKCSLRQGELWTSTISGTVVMACLACAGCFVLESALQRRSLQRGALPLSFVCSRCGDRYALKEVRQSAGALWCERCAPARVEPPPRPDLFRRLISLLRGE